MSTRRRPSSGEAKVTPSSSTWTRSARDVTWKPPESVSHGRCHDGEAVEAARGRDHGLARPLVQVIGVGEQDLGAERFELARGDAAHGAEGGDGHEGRRLDHAVRCHETRGAGAAVARLDVEGEAGAHQRISMASP